MSIPAPSQVGRESGVRRIYLAGPMSGIEDFNRPAFHREAARLRALGYHVENPAENPAPSCRSWHGYMRLAIAQLLTCDTLAYMPGSDTSKGALIELRLALELAMWVFPAESVTS